MSKLQDKIDGIDARIAELQALKKKHQDELARVTTIIGEATEADKELAIQLHEDLCNKEHGVPGGCYWQTLEDGGPDWSHETNAFWLSKAKSFAAKAKGKKP